MIWELHVVLIACTLFLSFGTGNLDLVYGLTHPPLLFCVHSERCFFADLCAYMYLSFLLQAWYLEFFFFKM